MDNILLSSSSEMWQTPDPLFEKIDQEFGPFDLDPAANRANQRSMTRHWFGDRTNDGHQPIFGDDSFIDGLARHWRGIDGRPATAFVNPPFCREKKMYVTPWIEKAFEEVHEESARRAVMLIPAKTDTSVWHRLVFPAASVIVFLRGRVHFVRPDGTSGPATFPSAIVVFSKVPGRAIHVPPHIATWETPR